MGRPRKDPSEKMVRVNLTLRPDDVRSLQFLAVERFSVGLIRGLEARNTEWLAGRPSISSAIRYLIDEERTRRLERARRRSKAKGISAEQLLENDSTFGSMIRRDWDRAGPVLEKLLSPGRSPSDPKLKVLVNPGKSPLSKRAVVVIERGTTKPRRR